MTQVHISNTYQYRVFAVCSYAADCARTAMLFSPLPWISHHGTQA